MKLSARHLDHRDLTHQRSDESGGRLTREALVLVAELVTSTVAPRVELAFSYDMRIRRNVSIIMLYSYCIY